MMSSVDGRIDCSMTEQIDPTDSYYDALDKLDCKSLLMGRVTMQMHYADSEPYNAIDKIPIGHQAEFIALKSDGYIIAIDTLGKLRWNSFCYDGKPLIVITSEKCPKVYLDKLTSQKISWIAVGENEIDLPYAMEILYYKFDIHRLAVVGGGHINGSFLAEGLLNEVSLMIGPGIDGRDGMTAVFDGIQDMNRPATLLKLESIEQVNSGTVWLRYKFA